MIVPHCAHGSCPTWRSILRATGLRVSRPPSPGDLLISREGRQTRALLLPQMQRRKPWRVRLTNTTPGAFTPSHPQQEVARSSFDSTLVLIKDFSLPPFFHLLKLHRSRPPGLSLALNLSLLPPPPPVVFGYVQISSLARKCPQRHPPGGLLVGLKGLSVWPQMWRHLSKHTPLLLSRTWLSLCLCALLEGGGCSHHCGLILIILPYGGWPSHNHP